MVYYEIKIHITQNQSMVKSVFNVDKVRTRLPQAVIEIIQRVMHSRRIDADFIRQLQITHPNGLLIYGENERKRKAWLEAILEFFQRILGIALELFELGQRR